MQILDTIAKALLENKTVILTIAGVLMTIAKASSNASAGPIISKIQAVVDVVALAVIKLGDILKLISELLANMIKSDGILGKK